ncbi:MAG: histidinol dehydrogenase [Thalassobaculaceae bacterium]|nr:histidinol dehydrogenase [Thalassobaculaceae bacterium]
MPRRLATGDAGFAEAFEDLVNSKRETEAEVGDVVAEIIAAVIKGGDSALIDYTKRFDRFDPTESGMAIAAAEIEAAAGRIAPQTRAALELAAERIESFHARQLPNDFEINDPAGLRLGLRWTSIDAVGLYVPGGTAAYPSSVLMNALPAKVAGVSRRVMVVPTPDGVVSDMVLAAARIAGITEIWRIGGAQAIAALAYGTESIAKVDKVVGPGNAYVAAAKRQVFGKVGIDSIAGPSEILVVADGDNDPSWIAIDLLSQAEHDTAAQAILITDDAGFADAVVTAVEDHLVTLPRAEIAAESWRAHGAVIVVGSMDEVPPLVDRLAPEHLELAVEDPDALSRRIRHAGAIFLGRFTPEAVGDYIAGPNHVLPTARTARFSSGLGVLDFMKRTTTVAADEAGLGAVGPAAITLAESEGLDAHARSIAVRLNRR